jgi:hypothetical protein
VVEGLKNWPTISRNYLFEPDFNYKNWLYDFIHNDKRRDNLNTGEINATSSTKKTNNHRPISRIYS